jgi:hypothetical protein
MDLDWIMTKVTDCDDWREMMEFELVKEMELVKSMKQDVREV